MADIERIKPCEGCTQVCAFEAVEEALIDPNETIKKAGELGVLLLSLQPKETGPKLIPGNNSGNCKELTICCRQPQALLVKSIIEKSRQAIKKSKTQQN